MHESDIFKKFTVAQFCQNIPFRFSQSNIPVSCSQWQIADRRAEPQEHGSHLYNKSDLQEISVTVDESS